MPVMCGSVTFSTAAIAIAASAAFPPRLRISIPASDASGWLVATIAWPARTTDRPTSTLENHRSGAEACASADAATDAGACASLDATRDAASASAGARLARPGAPAAISRNSRRVNDCVIADVPLVDASGSLRLGEERLELVDRRLPAVLRQLEGFRVLHLLPDLFAVERNQAIAILVGDGLAAPLDVLQQLRRA